MIVGIQDFYYNVRDIETSVAFYRDVLGLELAEENPHFTAFQISGVRFGLHWAGGESVPAIPKDSHGRCYAAR